MKEDAENITIPRRALDMLQPTGFIERYRQHCQVPGLTRKAAYWETEKEYQGYFGSSRFDSYENFRTNLSYHTGKTRKKEKENNKLGFLKISGVVERIYPIKSFWGGKYSHRQFEIKANNKKYFFKLQQFSTGGNIKMIERYAQGDTITVTFWIHCEASKKGMLITDLLVTKITLIDDKGQQRKKEINRALDANKGRRHIHKVNIK